MTAKQRVVVTGLGCVTPLGLNVKSTWDGLIHSRSAVGPITFFDSSQFPCKIAAEIKNFDTATQYGPFHPFGPDSEAVTAIAPPKDIRRLGRFVQLTLAAALEAYQDSGLDAVRSKIPADRMGTNIGVGMGGLPEIEATHIDVLEKGPRRISPFFIPQVIANMAAGQVSMLLNLKAQQLCTVTACASSAHSVGEAMRVIQRGEADVMFAGGAESTICKLGIGGFGAMKALSTANESPEKASRPFDKNRDGFVMAEGAAVLVLESLESAQKRGAKIYAEIVGYGATADAYHLTSPAPEGEGGYRAMSFALNEAGIDASQLGYVNAHATSTPTGDVEEARAIAKLAGSHFRNLHVSATKSMTGHLLGAAGAAEALFTIKALETGIIPPTINLDEIDPECEKLGLNFTPHKAVEKKITYALSNSFGFGGTNASILFKKA